MSKYLQPSIRGVIAPSRGNYIGPPDMTLWEHAYRKAFANHSYRIRDEWGATERDFMAYWNLRLQTLIGELGHPSARPVMAMNRWLQPIWRDGADPKDAPADKWREYERETATLWDSLSQDERDALRGLTPEQKADRAAWEALPEAEKEKLREGSYSFTRNHVDGRILNAKGETIGRWDDNRDGIRQFAIARGQDPDAAEAAWRAKQDAMPLIDQVRAYAAETHHGAAHVRRWNQVLTALGHDTGERAMTVAEAERNLARFSRQRWAPVVDAMRQMAPAPGRAVERVGAQSSPEQAVADAEAEESAYKAEQDAYAEEVREFQGEPHAQHGFDEWKRLQSPNGKLFPFNGTYVEDARTGCYIPYDRVARQRDELTAENVRYRLSRHPDGMVQISWLALNYEGCLCLLPESTETETRMVPAEEVPDLIWSGWRILTHKEYSKNQRVTGARDDKFEAFRLWVQYSPSDKPLGVCPTQGDSSDGKWRYNRDLFHRLHGHAVEEIAPVDAPIDIANAIQAGDWATVARLAQARAGQ